MKIKKTEELLSIIKELRDSGKSYTEIGNIVDADRGTISEWLNPKIALKVKLRKKKYNTSNKIKIAEDHRVWHKNNRDKILLRQKEYRSNSKDKLATYRKNRYKSDEQFRLNCLLRNRFATIFRNGTKVGSAVSDLGCSVEKLKQQLESQFTEGMSWENQGKWHIDHIRPLSSFDLTDREQFLQACHYTNLHPLWAEDNRSKGNYYEDEARLAARFL